LHAHRRASVYTNRSSRRASCARVAHHRWRVRLPWQREWSGWYHEIWVPDDPPVKGSTTPESPAVASATLSAPPSTRPPRLSSPPAGTGTSAGDAGKRNEFARGATELADSDPLIGHEIAGRYTIQKKLGQGGMGTVYMASHKALEKQVALKVLHGEFARKQDLVNRFMQEAKAASKIRHEHVIDISDFGTTPDGIVFFAMELLKGHDLHEDIVTARKEGGVISWERAKKIFLQVCGALSAAHKLGIVHRDLKPENVYLVEFLGDRDFVKLLDFGIAKLTELNDGDRKLTRTGMLFGTPEYMSPEQARGDKIDHRVDVYAMGCILYQLVTGHVPFEGDNFMGVLTQHLTEAPPAIPPEVFDQGGSPRALADVIAKALAKDRNQRYQSIDELAAAVRDAAGDAKLATAAPLPGTRQISSQIQRRHQTPAELGTQPTAAPDAATAAAMITVLPEPTKTRSTLAPMLKSKLPLLVGAGVVFCAGVVTAILLASGDDDTQPSAAPALPPQPAVAPAPTPPPPPVAKVEPPPPPPAPVPDQVVIKLDSEPHGAKIVDLTSQATLGKTPLTFRLHGSQTPRQFGLSLRGYGDTVIELVPNRERIEYTEKLEKGASTVQTVRVPDPVLKKPPPLAGSGSAPTPEAGSGSAAPPDEEPPAKKETPSKPEPKPDAKKPAAGSAEPKPDAKKAAGTTEPKKAAGSAEPKKAAGSSEP
jgi:eukaryotic-like serine/threonine-protein kinase